MPGGTGVDILYFVSVDLTDVFCWPYEKEFIDMNATNIIQEIAWNFAIIKGHLKEKISSEIQQQSYFNFSMNMNSKEFTDPILISIQSNNQKTKALTLLSKSRQVATLSTKGSEDKCEM
jgi:hypothetical protein